MKTPLLMAAIATGSMLAMSPAQAQGRGMPDFATLDANGDGQITLEEIEAAGAARFTDADTNGDGVLSAEELTAQIEARAEDRAATMAERMISRLDANEDGVLQQDELADRAGDRITKGFERADANDDGAISEEEFEQAAERRGRGHGRGGKGERGGRG